MLGFQGAEGGRGMWSGAGGRYEWSGQPMVGRVDTVLPADKRRLCQDYAMGT